MHRPYIEKYMENNVAKHWKKGLPSPDQSGRRGAKQAADAGALGGPKTEGDSAVMAFCLPLRLSARVWGSQYFSLSSCAQKPPDRLLWARMFRSRWGGRKRAKNRARDTRTTSEEALATALPTSILEKSGPFLNYYLAPFWIGIYNSGWAIP